MPVTNAILSPDAVDAYLIEHSLEYAEPMTIPTALLQHGGMRNGQPALLLVVEVDGRLRLVKTSLQMMETICSTMRAASGVPRGP